MNYDKLTETLRQHGVSCVRARGRYCSICNEAATALSTLQAENAQLRADLEYEQEHANAYHEECGQWEAENEKLRDELEQVKQERDAAVSWAQKYTESIDRPCVACKHNTGDYVCTAICGNCGPMGTESCKWEFDFSGELKEN